MKTHHLLQLALALSLIGIAFVFGTIVGYGDGYEAGLRNGMEMSNG